MSGHRSWLRNYIAKTSGPWKAAACFFFLIVALMALNAAAILAGWHGVSYRLVAYLGLAFVGFFASLLFHAYLSIRASRVERQERRKRRDGTKQ